MPWNAIATVCNKRLNTKSWHFFLLFCLVTHSRPRQFAESSRRRNFSALWLQPQTCPLCSRHVCKWLRKCCVLSKLEKGEGMERRRGNWILEVERKVPSTARLLIFWQFLCMPGFIEGLVCPSHGQKIAPDYGVLEMVSNLQKALKPSPLLKHCSGSRVLHGVYLMGVHEPVHFFSGKEWSCKHRCTKESSATSQEHIARFATFFMFTCFLVTMCTRFCLQNSQAGRSEGALSGTAAKNTTSSTTSSVLSKMLALVLGKGGYIDAFGSKKCYLRPYRDEHTASRPIREVKHRRGQRVLPWVTRREHCAAAG